MSQLLFRLSKLSSRNNELIHKSVRLFSTSPYLTLGSVVEDLPEEDGSYIGDILLFDPAKEELVTVRDKTIPEKLVNSRVVGASHGWTFFSDRCNHNSKLSGTWQCRHLLLTKTMKKKTVSWLSISWVAN
jgi:hypothetical protein